MLTALILARDDDTGRPVTQSHRAVSRIDMLATLTTGAERVYVAFGQQVDVGVGNYYW